MHYSIITINYSPKQSTQFFDKDGKLIANTFKDENRDYVKYDEIFDLIENNGKLHYWKDCNINIQKNARKNLEKLLSKLDWAIKWHPTTS